ncbi:MAG TPA: retropepsin-like aspartic protease, partial [Vicinamibacteria bacterium]|nr:retropepsin-like aspartic protease [Vicinamibacteria bacterium]
WLGLGRALDASGPFLYRGAVAAAFNDARAERLLRSVIDSAPASDDAYEAYEGLSHLYLRDGQYLHMIEAMERRWASFPGRAAEAGEREAMAPFRDLPDQHRVAFGAATLRHEGNIFVPLSIQGGAARYFFDTGAWLSCMSESEARRLGLTASAGRGSVGTSTGASVGLRMAVAREVVVGTTRFENVSFAVFPDDQEPWSGLPLGQRGIIGIPLLLGLQTVRWSHDGTVTVGQEARPLRIEEANLIFDDDHLVATVGFEKERVRLTLDTGAETTDLYQGFAEQFATLLSRTGQKGVHQVRGVGQAETFESVSLPEAHFEVGGRDTVLRPAHVLLKSIGAKRSTGNLGIDLLQQAAAFRIDLGAMTLELEALPTP